MICPRNASKHEDEYLKDDTCSYCGSLNPDTFMARLESGDVTLEPTDKDYKVYVRGKSFLQTYRTDSKPFAGYDSPVHDWVTRQVNETKFYFYHLSEDQRRRFIELVNEKRITFEPPYHFYNLPFFMREQI